jgi:hypothetical protein
MAETVDIELQGTVSRNPTTDNVESTPVMFSIFGILPTNLPSFLREITFWILRRGLPVVELSIIFILACVYIKVPARANYDRWIVIYFMSSPFVFIATLWITLGARSAPFSSLLDLNPNDTVEVWTEKINKFIEPRYPKQPLPLPLPWSTNEETRAERY